MLGSMKKDSAWKLLDAYYEAGGNFIDSAVHFPNRSDFDL